MLSNLIQKYNKGKDLFFPKHPKRMRLHYAKYYESKPMKEDLVLYETRDGSSIVDSPYAIFLYLATSPEYAHLKHVWVVQEKNKGIEASIPVNLRSKVTFVYRNTLQYVDAMLEAKYLISNSTFESFFVKRPGQVYINTWHGTPLKYMGFDIPGKLSGSQNVLRNFLMTDYLLSPNEHTTNIFKRAYKLQDIYPGEILEAGYPRIDATINAKKEAVLAHLAQYGLKIDETKPILLFSPTWKGTNIHQTTDDIDQIVTEIKCLEAKFGATYNLLLKVHPYAYEKFAEDERVRHLLVSDFMNANDLLGIVDLLITDYSSIFFDYLVTKKPIIFYVWDKDLYSYERGLYIAEEELPGPIAENLDELLQMIADKTYEQEIYRQKYEIMAQKMVSYDDGQVTKRIVDYIFKNKKDKKMKVKKLESNKKKILLYPGGLANNGITSSCLNLLNHIDYNKYDVTLFLGQPRTADNLKNLQLLNENVRPLFRFGIEILTRQEIMKNNRIANHGLKQKEAFNYPQKGYEREMNRLMANLSFDVAIDFSSYSFFWARHILAANAKRHLTFLHSDMAADAQKIVNGKMPHAKTLPVLFSVLHRYDEVLSVSQMTCEVNREKLAQYVDASHMSYVYNTINIDKILNPKTKKMLTEEPLKIDRENLEVKETTKTKAFKNIEAIKKNEAFELSLIENQHAVQHAKFTIQGQSYLKVSINNVYIGWIKENYFEKEALKIEKIENYHGFATVARGYGYPIWKEIKTNTSKDEIVTYARTYKQRYLEIHKVAYTTGGRFFLVSYNRKKIGWVSGQPLRRVHLTKPYAPINLYFKYRMKMKERELPVVSTEKIETVKLLVKIKEQTNAHLWTQPKGMNEAQVQEMPEEYKGQVFIATEKNYVSAGVYLSLSLFSGEFVGYLSEEAVEYLPQEKFEEYEQQSIAVTGSELPQIDLAYQPIPEFEPTYTNLVTMGRLSPEKNFDKLITAFAKFNEQVPNSRLYIIGKGPQEEVLIQQLKALNLEGKLFFVGHLSQPFEFLKQMSVFILPSLYEGQPMVLLEAMTLGLRILASNIPANINVLGQNEKYGLLTKGTSDQDIYEGLLRMYNYEAPFASFDPYEYNEQALAQFYRALALSK